MKILELVLYRCKRLVLSGIEKIKYTPTAEVQIIIGSNGSGKSSLMDELNPLPPSKDSILPGGYKQIIIEHCGDQFTLRSDFKGKTAKHSFVHNTEDGDVELNEGGTGAAQKILIEKYFSITTELMDIWIGRTRFSRMAPNKRRDLILAWSGSDLEYAMKLFHMVRGETRDAQGLERHYAKRLGEETSDIADQNRITELEDNVQRLTNELNDILTQKEPNVPSIHHVKMDIQRLLNSLNDYTSEVLTLRLVKPSCIANEQNNILALETYLSGSKANLQALEKQLTELYSDQTKLNEALDILRSNGVSEIDELRKVTEELRKEINQMIKDTPLYKELEGKNIGQMVGAYQGCKGLLVELLSTMYDNTDGHFTNQKVTDAKNLLIKIENRISHSKESISRARHQLEHFNNTHDVNCPKCEHTFKPGFVNTNPDELHAYIQKGAGLLTNLEVKQKETEDYLEGAKEYLSQVNSLKRLMNDNAILSPLWDILAEENIYKVSPIRHLPTVNNFMLHLENCFTISELAKKHQMNNDILSSAKSVTQNQETLNLDYASGLDVKISQVLDEISRVKGEVYVVEKYAFEVKKALALGDKVKSIESELEVKYDILFKAIKNKSLSEISQSRQIALANSTSALNNIARHEAVINELKQEKVKAADRYSDLSVLQAALSPVDGVISKYIQNFLDQFVADMNEVIDEIWTYPMEILSCGVDSNDVTCKFPISINHGYLVTEDVSKGSAGQVDIIDFVFKLVMGRYLGLSDLPLYLDELAPTLDEQHRLNLIRYLNNVMECGQYNQMYMISHYSSNHYAFAGSEILLLDGRNIVSKPETFNTHVEIEYRTITEDAA